MKKLSWFWAALLCVVWLSAGTGCISVPKFHPPAPLPQSPAALTSNQPLSKPSLVEKIFEPSKAAAQEQAIAAVPVPKNLIIDDSPVKKTVDREAVWFWVIGVLCLLAAGGCAYVGLYAPALKLLAAGVLLPIAATWFVYHYVSVIAFCLISAAIGYLWSQRNSNWEKSLLSESTDEIHGLANKLQELISTAKKNL